MGLFMELLRILGACTLAAGLALGAGAVLKRLNLLPAKPEPEARKGLRKERS